MTLQLHSLEQSLKASLHMCSRTVKNVPGIPGCNSKNTGDFTEFSTNISMDDSHNLMLSEEVSHTRINAVRK